MKSILWQLEKYHGVEIEAENIVEISRTPQDNDIEFSVEELAAVVGCLPEDLNRMPIYPGTQILYPLELLAIYYLVSEGILVSNAENKCNEATIGFLRQQEPYAYVKEFENKLGDYVYGIMAARVARATYHTESDLIMIYGEEIKSSEAQRKYDKLPEHLRSKALEILGMPRSSSVKLVMDKLDSLISGSNLEQQILGRIGYLMVWRQLNEMPQGPPLLIFREG